MYFCVRDDDTSFFTSPAELERTYSAFTKWGPISLAIIPFCRAGRSRWVPAKVRERWSVHPLHENRELVDYLRAGIAAGRFEAMLHGYYHDEPTGRPEFAAGDQLTQRVADGRQYLEDLLETTIRVFVPPHNTVSRQGLRAIASAGLHLGGIAGVRSGWPLLCSRTWRLWWRLRHWRMSGGLGVPWILDLGDHREIAGNAVTPLASFLQNERAFETALSLGGVFGVATHYWELDMPSIHAGAPKVGDQLRYLIERAIADPRVIWRSVGEIISVDALVI